VGVTEKNLFELENLMKRLSVIPVACVCMLLPACSNNDGSPSGAGPSATAPKSKFAEQLVGKWQGDDETWEFVKDGTMLVSFGKEPIKGKYKVEGENTLIVEMENPFEPAKTKAVKLTASLAKEELTVTNDEEKNDARKTRKFKRK